MYCLLGLNRRERPLIKYRQACLKQYEQLQRALMNELVLLQKPHSDTENKRTPSRPSIQLTPVLQIPFKELEYDKKIDKIGSGSYGEVYRGWWQGKYSVAVKELTGTLTAVAEKDLYREAGIMAYMAKVSTEPYPTVRLFGLAMEKPNYALVMEYVPNGTLFDLLQLYSEAKLPWDLRYQLAVDIADGIALLHRQHILHRDLRSHNILLNITEGRLRAKLSDFGLSTVKSSVRTYSTVPKKTESVGTLAWMAPELHTRGGQSSPASDIYSFGMVLWELLTNAIPFADAQGNTDLISKWVVTDRETETIPSDCPSELAALIKKCWAFKPEDRILLGDIQKQLAVLIKAHPLSPQTQAIIETLKKSQEEREVQWNARWLGKGRGTEQQYQPTVDQEEPDFPPPPPPVIIPPPPKPKVSLTQQLALQDQLITACKQGDAKAVKTLLQQGAKPDRADAKGEQPLGAAVWGMCPDVVNALLAQADKVAPMTWEECEQHNLKYYKEMFIVPKFEPQTYEDWYQLLLKMNPNLFICAFHLKMVDEVWHDKDSSSWERLKRNVHTFTLTGRDYADDHKGEPNWTEQGFANYRSQIKQGIESAKQPIKLAQEDLKYESPIQPLKSTPPLRPVSQIIQQTILPPPNPKASPAQLALQDQLIAACKQGDAKAIRELFKRGAKPDMANTKGEQPLGAAVWGMCPDVVNALLTQTGGVAPMTWKECEKHNQKFYEQTFIVSRFEPHTEGEWQDLLQKIDFNSFIRSFHLQKVNELWRDDNTASWEKFKMYRGLRKKSLYLHETIGWNNIIYNQLQRTEEGFALFRSQIKQTIESSIQPIGEINALQQHQIDLKLTQQDLKYELPVQPPKSTSPLPPMSQIIQQTISAPPKPKASPEQLKLQDQLIAACKQGDAKAVGTILQQGAKPDMANTKGEQPLGAAVWGMCPDVVNTLLKQADGVAPMTWQECEKHNQKYYKEVFIVPKFAPQTFREWNDLLQKMDPNPFIRAYHLKKADEQHYNMDTSSWAKLKDSVFKKICRGDSEDIYDLLVRNRTMEEGFVGFKTQIKQHIESAKQPTAHLNF